MHKSKKTVNKPYMELKYSKSKYFHIYINSCILDKISMFIIKIREKLH